MTDFTTFVEEWTRNYRHSVSSCDADGRSYNQRICYLFHEGTPTAEQVLAALRSSSLVAIRNERYYSDWILLSMGSYPSMCGGSLVVVRSVQPNELFNHNMYSLRQPSSRVLNTLPEDPAAFMQDLRKGILLFSAVGSAANHVVSNLLSDMERYFNSGPVADVTCARTGGRGESFHLLVHYLDDKGHEENCGSTGRGGRRNCPYCGRFVSIDGYCSWCCEYTLEGISCTDDVNIGQRSDWVEEALEEREWYKDGRSVIPDMISDYHARRVLPQHEAVPRSITTRVSYGGTLSVHSRWRPCYVGRVGIATNPNPVDYLAAFFLHTAGCQGAIAISSNVGTPQYPGTRWVMAMLVKYAADFAARGIKVIQPAGMATNPNERDHYIDSLVLVIDTTGA